MIKKLDIETNDRIIEEIEKFINHYAGTGEWLIPKNARKNLFSKISKLLKSQKEQRTKEIIEMSKEILKINEIKCTKGGEGHFDCYGDSCDRNSGLSDLINKLK